MSSAISRRGESPLEAAFKGEPGRLVGPIIAMTITLAAVYPRSEFRRLNGALFREFAFTLAGAVIVSGVVAR